MQVEETHWEKLKYSFAELRCMRGEAIDAMLIEIERSVVAAMAWGFYRHITFLQWMKLGTVKVEDLNNKFLVADNNKGIYLLIFSWES